MNKAALYWMKMSKATFFGLVFVQIFAVGVFAQTKTPTAEASPNKIAVNNSPKVTQIDAAGLKNLLRPNGKPLLVNFWATWCEPCREEFPDLVKIDADFKGKFDFITVSLDDAEEIKTGVPKFLAEMKATMPSYILVTPSEDVVISSISKEWQGGLPFTMLYDAEGKTVYSKMGKIKPDVLRAEIGKLISSK